jgi:hypothetical protein
MESVEKKKKNSIKGYLSACFRKEGKERRDYRYF